MRILKKRRQKGKTNYKKRLALLKGKSPRIVLRKTNRYLIAQYVSSQKAQDKIEFGFNSKDLVKFGWPKEFKGSLKSTPAAYLIGLLTGKKILKLKKNTPIVDFGMIRNLHKSKIYAFVKGLVDLGIKIKYDEKIFPEENRIKGKHLKKDFSEQFNKIKSEIESK